MEYAIFLGCTVPVRARNYEMSARNVAQYLGIDLVDVEGFSCCGFPVASTNRELTLLLSARALAQAEEKGKDIVALCSACAGSLSEAKRELDHNPELREEMNKQLSEAGLQNGYSGKVNVRHFARMLLEDVGLETIRSKVVRDLSSLKVVPHYGCHYVKPSEATGGFDNPERPSTLDALLQAAGTSVIDYAGRNRCCGGGVLVVDKNASFGMARAKLEDAHRAGASCICVICGFCAIMYDDNQSDILGSENAFELPVLYLPQILGLAFGLEPKALGMKLNKVKTSSLLDALPALS